MKTIIGCGVAVLCLTACSLGQDEPIAIHYNLVFHKKASDPKGMCDHMYDEVKDRIALHLHQAGLIPILYNSHHVTTEVNPLKMRISLGEYRNDSSDAENTCRFDVYASRTWEDESLDSNSLKVENFKSGFEDIDRKIPELAKSYRKYGQRPIKL